ncbi:MAG: hypothetical protein ACREE6_09635 [Limisphaerales bacterium]
MVEIKWSSPKGKFAGAGKEISEELGRKPESWPTRRPCQVYIGPAGFSLLMDLLAIRPLLERFLKHGEVKIDKIQTICNQTNFSGVGGFARKLTVLALLFAI